MRTIPKKAKKRKPVLYALEPISNEGIEDPENGPLKTEGPYVVEGELLGSIVVSVPETMSNHSAQELNAKLSEHYGKPVFIVTHNISFLLMRRVTKGEAAKVGKRLKGDLANCKDCRYKGEKDKDDNVVGHTVEVGSGEPVILDKLYGGAIFSTMRLTAITGRGWVVERLLEHDEADNEWVEVGEFPAWVEEEKNETGGK